MHQPELFPTSDDQRIVQLKKHMETTEFWSPSSVDKLEKAGRMYRVLSGTVAKCFDELKGYERSINSRTG